MAKKFHLVEWEQEARLVDYDPVVVAQKHDISLRRLEQYCQSLWHESPRSLFTRLKLEDARQLIEQGLPVNEVSGRFGYSHPSHFIAAFQRQFGCSPHQHFRRALAARISSSRYFASLSR